MAVASAGPYMQVCTSLQTDNHASTPLLKFFTGRMPFPTNSVKALKARDITIMIKIAYLVYDSHNGIKVNETASVSGR